MSLEIIDPQPGEFFMKCDKCEVETFRTPFTERTKIQAFTPAGWSRVKISSLASDPFADDLYMDYCYDCTNGFEFTPDRTRT